MPESKTPRTDKQEVVFNMHGGVYVLASFSRKLELENQTLRAAQKACEDCDAPAATEHRKLLDDFQAEQRTRAITQCELGQWKECATELADVLQVAAGYIAATSGQKSETFKMANKAIAKFDKLNKA